MSLEIEPVDRYEGIGYPDPATVCDGECEGLGVIPVYMRAGDKRIGGAFPEDETDPDLVAVWEKAENDSPAEDGWHFVQCPVCKGSGKLA